MNYNDWAYIGHQRGWLGSPLEGAPTSKAATVSLAVRAGSQRAKLLAVYRSGCALDDTEAAERAGLNRLGVCFWKRCSELRQAGYIISDGNNAADTRMACRITAAGRSCLNTLGYAGMSALAQRHAAESPTTERLPI